MLKSEFFFFFCFNKAWDNLGIVQAMLALLSVYVNSSC